jgi:hypothetical protein
MVALGIVVIATSSCGDLDAHVVGIEAGSVASTATEGSLLAGQASRGRVPVTFTRIQAQTLAEQFGKTLQAIGSSATTAPERELADRVALLALAGQRNIRQLASDPANRGEANKTRQRLADISNWADELVDMANNLEAAQKAAESAG